MSFDLREWQVAPGNWNRLNEILGLLGSQEIPATTISASGVLSRDTDVTSDTYGEFVLKYDTDQFDESPASTLHIQHFHTDVNESTYVGIDTEDGGAVYSTHVGYQAGKSNEAAHNIFIGAEVAKDNVYGFANVAIGNYNMLNATGPVARNTAVGYYNQLNLLSNEQYFSAAGNTSVGAFCASNLKTALFNEAYGYYALYSNKYGHGNCAIGYRTLYSLDAVERIITAFADAGGGNVTVTADTTGLSNGDTIRINGTFNYDGPETVANLSGNTFTIVAPFVADDATGFIIKTNEASANVAMGGDAGYSTTTGAFNVYMGWECGYSNTTGLGNIFIGYQAGYNEAGSNKLYIENSNSATPLIYGEFDNDIVNINGLLTVDGLKIKYVEDDVADPPTDAQLDTAFGTPATLGAGYVGILDDNSADTDVYICFTNDNSWWYIKGTKAALVSAIDSAEKRKSISGIPFLIPGVTPNSDKDQEWRQEAGWCYSGIEVSG